MKEGAGKEERCIGQKKGEGGWNEQGSREGRRGEKEQGRIEVGDEGG